MYGIKKNPMTVDNRNKIINGNKIKDLKNQEKSCWMEWRREARDLAVIGLVVARNSSAK